MEHLIIIKEENEGAFVRPKKLVRQLRDLTRDEWRKFFDELKEYSVARFPEGYEWRRDFSNSPAGVQIIGWEKQKGAAA